MLSPEEYIYPLVEERDGLSRIVCPAEWCEGVGWYERAASPVSERVKYLIHVIEKHGQEIDR